MSCSKSGYGDYSLGVTKDLECIGPMVAAQEAVIHTLTDGQNSRNMYGYTLLGKLSSFKGLFLETLISIYGNIF